MSKRNAISFFNSPRFYFAIFMVSLGEFTLAQSSTVSFQVDGSVSVTNDVLYLQKIIPLNLMELYKLPSDTDPRGILMLTPPKLGDGGRAEIRIFDYDQKNKRRGALIYAASGDKSGWNENNWNATESLFEAGVCFSEKVGSLFNIEKINTTNIKILTQFEELDFVCEKTGSSAASYNSCISGALNNSKVPMIRYKVGVTSTKRQPGGDDDTGDNDNDGEDNDNDDEDNGNGGNNDYQGIDADFYRIYSAGYTAAHAAAEESRKKLADAIAAKKKADKEYQAAADAKQETLKELKVARFRHEAALSLLEDAWAEVTATQAALSEAKARKTDPTSVEGEARDIIDAAIAFVYQCVERSNKAKLHADKKSVEATLATLQADQDRQAADDANNDVDSKEVSLHDAINRFEQAQRRASDFKFRVILARDAYNIARTMVNLHERSLIQAKVALMASPTQANQAVYDAVIERLASATFHKGQTGRRFDQEKRAWKAAHEAELKAEENIKMAEEELETAKTIAQSLAGQAWQSAVTSRLSTLSADSASTAALTARVRAIEAGMAVHLLRARVGDPAQVLDVNIRIAELNSNNARARLSEVQRDVEAAAEEYNAAEQANKEALAVFEKVVLARIEASADVIEARKKFDDDDNEAGAAAAAAQIAELAADPDLNPYLLQKLLSIFGYPYLVNDVLDLELFHNPTTTTKAQEDFLTEYKNYAIQSAPNKSWCDWVSPMPVVLVELVVRNSEVYAINVPGLPWLTPAHFIPKSLHYIDDAADQTLPVTLGTKLTTTSAVYEIEQTPYITQVDLIGFPKYDHIVLPDFNTIATSDSKQEFTMDSWNRLPLVGTDETFCDLKEQLEAAAKEAGAENNYYALTEISHDYMMVKNLTTNQINKFILAVLTINREYDNTVSLTVTDSGPFVVNNGVRSKQQLPIDIDSEIFMRKASTENVLIPDADGNQSVYDGPVKVYPNPTVDLVNVEFNLQEKSQVTLKIINAWGNSVYEEKASLLAGWHSKEIDIKKMSPAGLYIISVTTPHGSRMTKVLVE